MASRLLTRLFFYFKKLSIVLAVYFNNAFILIILISLPTFIFYYQKLIASTPFPFESRTEDNALFYDLALAKYWDDKMNVSLPVTYNHLLEGGYWTTPSARMGRAGDMGFGVAKVPPYLHTNIRFQPFYHFELSLNYRIFEGIQDPGMGSLGFGDYADRGANFKWALVTPEDSQNIFPGIAIGCEDFMGSEKFKTFYFVSTKNWTEANLETSIGWGTGRFADGPAKGLFGGVAWFPFWKCGNPLLEGISAAAEFDPINYNNPDKEPHPEGRETSTPLNFGIKFNYLNWLNFSASLIRGREFAFSGSFMCNLGVLDGLLPKIEDPLPYALKSTPFCSIDEPFVKQLKQVLCEQGFDLRSVWKEGGEECKRLRISINNLRYRTENCVRTRITHIMAALVPREYEAVAVVVETEGIPCHQYLFYTEILDRFCKQKTGYYEMEVLTPLVEAEPVNRACNSAELLFKQKNEYCKFIISPDFQTFFGSSKGKFKYNLGVRAQIQGLLPRKYFFHAQTSYIPFSSMGNVSDYDRYNPSQLPNVWTDYVNYRRPGAFTVDDAYIQKNWNLGCGFFYRLSGGYFEVAYAGAAGELLYYPANSLFAIGIEGSLLKKRRYHGLGFQNKLRHLEGYTPVYRHYSFLDQYFLTFYYDFQQLNIETKISFGQFLAKDKGARLELTRYFKNGLRLSGWMTITNADDFVNGTRYYNRGVAIELPLDLFFKYSSKRVWNYGLAAWLRDAGAQADTGRSLYEVINRERR